MRCSGSWSVAPGSRELSESMFTCSLFLENLSSRRLGKEL